MMFLLDGVFNFNMINYIKVRFFDYEESAFLFAMATYSNLHKMLYIKYN